MKLTTTVLVMCIMDIGHETTCTSEKEFFIDMVSANSSIHISPDCAFVQLHIGPKKTPVNSKIDTVSSVNILP